MTLQSCYDAYSQQNDLGYKAFAVAYDNPYFICSYSAGTTKEKYAVELALDACEQGRIHPQSEVKGVRTVMTRCKVDETDLIE